MRLPLLALLLAPALANAGAPPTIDKSAYTGDSSICMKGEIARKKTCVLKEGFLVPTPDGRDMVEMHYLVYVDERDLRQFGLADEKGRLVVEAGGYDMVNVALNSKTLLSMKNFERGGGYAWLRRPGGKNTALNEVKRFMLGGFGDLAYPLYVAQLQDAENKNTGLAVLRLDGSLGPEIKGAGFDTAFVLGDFVMFTLKDPATGATGSIAVDVAGEVAWAGPEVRNVESMRGEGQVERTAMMAIGDSPYDLDAKERRLWTPFDSVRGPIALPEGVLGIVPAPFMPYGIYGDKNPRYAKGWMIIAKGPQRLFDYELTLPGDPADYAKRYASVGAFDDARMVPHGSVSFLAAHHRKSGQWFAYGGAAPGKGATPEEAKDDVIRGAIAAYNAEQLARRVKDAEIEARAKANNAEREKADAAYAAARKAKWQTLIPEMGKACSNPPGSFHCGEVEEAAYGLGEPYATDFLKQQTSFFFTGRSDEACRVSATACAEAKRIDGLNAARAQEKREAQQRLMSAFKERMDAAAAGPDVKVNYYEGGRLQQKTMSWGRYQDVYGR